MNEKAEPKDAANTALTLDQQVEGRVLEIVLAALHGNIEGPIVTGSGSSFQGDLGSAVRILVKQLAREQAQEVVKSMIESQRDVLLQLEHRVY